MNPWLLPIILALASACPGAAHGAEPWTPERPDLSRYRPTWEKDPFRRATAPDASPGFAAYLAVSAISRIGDDLTVLLIDKRTRTYRKLGTEPDAEGLRILEVLPHADRREARVRVGDGTRDALLSYEPAPSRPKKATPPSPTSATVSPPVSPTLPSSPAPEAEPPEKPPVRLKLRLPPQPPDEAAPITAEP